MFEQYLYIFLRRYTVDSRLKDMIYRLVFKASETSHILNIISTNFVEVSDRHIMSRIAGKSCVILLVSGPPEDFSIWTMAGGTIG